ncbi:MFS transporter [Streptomyces sp. AM 4-1-1]|uniref:MFS transporter n=1 Tax=Streptomyces sp. AM 4-1-1 TaxID=3028710 RepID=UPI0023BA0DC0|nr:MFS transporter [Streptomyces sp. AM 4-1-1]WEH34718.1 MFS transporter [Streptomyces sp. AM 4-1-1]
MDKRRVVRRLLTAQGVNGFGDGLWFSIWAIYLTRIRDIPAANMGLAMGIGGVIGLLAAVPIGVMAERRGPREVLGTVIVLRGLIMIAYVFVGGFWSLLLVTSFFSAVQSSAVGVRVTLVYGLMEPDSRLRVLAQGRVVQHITYAAGAGIAILVLASDRQTVFVAAVLVDALALLLTGALTMLVPSVPPVPHDRQHSGTRALRDLPYVAIMGSTALLSLCWALLSSGLPLWIAEDTRAPLWTAGLAVVVSSAAIAVFQVRISRRSVRIAGAVRSSRISATALAVCCVVFAAAAWTRSPVIATTVIILGMGAHIVGELYYVSSRWGLSLGLMAKNAEGQYQGVTAGTEAAAVAMGPALVTSLVVGLSEVGWVILAALFLLSAVPVGALGRRAARDGFRVGHQEPEEPRDVGPAEVPAGPATP